MLKRHKNDLSCPGHFLDHPIPLPHPLLVFSILPEVFSAFTSKHKMCASLFYTNDSELEIFIACLL